jgi:thiol-disulfide isomerase/thioredoxin
MRHIQLIIAVLLIIIPLTSQSNAFDENTNTQKKGYKIEVTINGLKQKDLYLGFHYGRKQFLQDTIRLDKNGHGVFQGDKKLDQGIYLVITPSKNYFEILVGKDQHFSLEAQKGDFLKTLNFEGSEVNEAFNEYQKFMREKNQVSRKYQKRLKKNKGNSDSTDVLRSKLEELDKEVKAKWDSLINEYPGTILATIIKAMKKPEIPDFETPENAANKDSIIWAKKYNYQKNHYFDNIDLSDPRLVKTPILHNKVKHYFDNVLRQKPDTIIRYVDKVLNKARENDQTFEYLARFLINNYQKSKIMGMDEVFVHIAEKYYLSGDAHWIDSSSLKKLRGRVQKIKPNIIGKTAPDMKLPTINNKHARLHNIDSKYTIVYFWEPGCSHCKKVTPKIYNLYKSYDRKTLEVYAVYTQVDKKKWDKYINKHDFDWINVFDPYNTSKFRKKYDIYSTPTIYLLNEDKKIIAKRIGHEALKKMLEQKIDGNKQTME